MSSVAFIAIVAGILLVVGTLVAMAWFTMSRRIAPYKDELEAQSRRKVDDENVVVITPPSPPGTPTSRRP